MTLEQQKIVEDNMGLVGKVIKEKVHGLGQPGTPSYDDLFQTGCIGLIKAVLTDKGGTFSTYAYRLIWNEICDELVRNTRLVLKELPMDMLESSATPLFQVSDFLEQHILHDMLQQVKQQAKGGAAKGIHCLELMVQGYSSQEISAIIGADPGTIRMWITRARRYLKSNPDLRQYAEAI